MHRFGLWLARLSLILAAHTSPASDLPTVTLGTNAVSAYSTDRKPRQSQGVVSQVDCIFSHLPYQLELHYQPWRRVQQEVSNGRLAGFFTAMPDPQFERYAQLSDPLILQKWHWFTRADFPLAEDPRTMRTGAILGSHQQLWLDMNNVEHYLAVQDLPQLIKLLFAGRIDAVLADREHFDRAANELGVEPVRYRSRFFQYVPLGVYFGQHFLEEHSDFLALFNRYIHACVPQSFALSSEEQTVIKQLLQSYIDDWSSHSMLLERLAIRELEPAKTAEEIQRLDTLWREAYQRKNTHRLNAMLDDGLSGLMLLWKSEHPVLTELIAIDRQGLNLAAVPYTSDYWQGDEAKYQQAYFLSPGSWFFDEVVYDHSTHRFQTQVSVPIDSADGRRLGVLTLGVDIEKALKAGAGNEP